MSEPWPRAAARVSLIPPISPVLQNQPLPANIDLHHLIERDAVLAPIVELRGARGGMGRHLARLLQRAAILEISRDTCAAEGVVADFRCDAGRPGATAHHSPSIVSVEPLTIELRLPTTIRAI